MRPRAALAVRADRRSRALRRAAVVASALITLPLGCHHDRIVDVPPPGRPPPPPASAPTPSAIVDFTAFAAQAQRACKPAGEARTIDEDKIQHAAMIDCLVARLGADREHMLAPIKATRPSRAAAIAREEADLDAFVRAFADLRERVMWIVLGSGIHAQGSGIDTGRLACETSGYLERLYFVHALTVDAVPALAARAPALATEGTASRATLTPIRAAVARWTAPGAVVPDDARGSWEWPVEADEWREIGALARAVEARAERLAISSCRTVRGAAEALGGPKECERRMLLYYFGHCEMEIHE